MKWQTVFVVPMLAPHPTPYLLSFSLFSPIGCFFHLFSRYFWCYSFQSTLLWLLYNQSKTFHCMLYKKKGSRFYHSPHYTILYTANSTLLLSPSDIHSRSDIYHVLLSCSQTEPSSGPAINRSAYVCLQTIICIAQANVLHIPNGLEGWVTTLFYRFYTTPDKIGSFSPQFGLRFFLKAVYKVDIKMWLMLQPNNLKSLRSSRQNIQLQVWKYSRICENIEQMHIFITINWEYVSGQSEMEQIELNAIKCIEGA